MAILKRTIHETAIFSGITLLKSLCILAPLHVRVYKVTFSKDRHVSSQLHEATCSSTVPSGYKGIEMKEYVAVASRAERCCHVAL